MKTYLVFCVDATADIGAGHVMRCLALAQQWQARGGVAVFIGRLDIPWVRNKVTSEGVIHHAPKSRPLYQRGPEPLCATLRSTIDQLGADPARVWVVLDGYGFDIHHQRAIRAAGFRLLVMDDYNHLPEYEADILVNQNYLAGVYKYAGDIGRHLIGSRYTFLRREFVDATVCLRRSHSPDRAKHILISLGGGDASEHLPSVEAVLRGVDLTGCIVYVVAGGMPKDRLETLATALSCEVRFLVDVANMAELLAGMDFAITAGGSFCWELCCMGVPFSVFSLTENQDAVVKNLNESGISVPFEPFRIQESILHYSSNAEKIKSMCGLIDGKGTARICDVLTGADSGEVEVRNATLQDLDFVYSVANESSVRAVSFSSSEIAYASHCRWFVDRLHSDNKMFIGSVGTRDCGYVRLDVTDNVVMISIAVSSQCRGSGVGTALLLHACTQAEKTFSNMPVRALVKVDNMVSRSFFERLGFRAVSKILIHGNLTIEYEYMR